MTLTGLAGGIPAGRNDMENRNYRRKGLNRNEALEYFRKEISGEGSIKLVDLDDGKYWLNEETGEVCKASE